MFEKLMDYNIGKRSCIKYANNYDSYEIFEMIKNSNHSVKNVYAVNSDLESGDPTYGGMMSFEEFANVVKNFNLYYSSIKYSFNDTETEIIEVADDSSIRAMNVDNSFDINDFLAIKKKSQTR